LNHGNRQIRILTYSNIKINKIGGYIHLQGEYNG
jgi:hypothetical protein